MKIIKKDLSEISTHKYERMDYKYWNTYEAVKFKSYFLLKDMFELINGSVQTSNYVTEKTSIPYIRIGDIDYKYGLSTEESIYLDADIDISDEKLLKKYDLVLATIGATVGKIGLADKAVGGIHSNNTVVLRPKDKTINIRYYEKLFQTDFYINYIFGLVAQKAQPNLQPYEIENIRIPIIDEAVQQKCMEEVQSIELKIEALKKKIKSKKTIMDEVFIKEFHLDYKTMMEIDKMKIFNRELSEITVRNSNVRNSCRWNKAVQIQNCLCKSTECVKLGKYIITTKNGWSPSCSEYGEYQVLGLNAINSNGTLSFDNPKFSSEKKSNLPEFFIKNGDFFVSRGNTVDLVSMASVASVETDTPSTIYPDLMIRIKFSKDVDVHYMAYIFNSFIGRLYFKYSTKGKNQTMVKVSPYELSEFLVPLPDIEKQKEIVKKINKEVETQQTLRKEMNQYRAQIDKLVTKSFSCKIAKSCKYKK